ncbi:sodium-coupled monocarboxylate transporter 1 isoform X1 [Patella vulgata]|uniref:sodium-coupled monocarboxylate transporter 1 isoform X1 n=3 Tax=Patella vulgata TaxID=6465 RepID=UPI00218080D6|nr:sodium-coupled monocarboxylate transporter 1 isoform X1 [Patella vulgata]
MSDVRSFEAWDYVLFSLLLLVSAVIGIYYAVQARRNASMGEFLMASRSLGIIPVSVSILVSFMSAILILGTPAEMYVEGTGYCVYLIGMIFAIVIAAITFVPLLYSLKLTSSFEYLQYRFNSKAAKLTGTCIMIIQQILYMGVASYAPSTALEAVTGFPVWATIITVGLVATFYTSLGGMKAVIWTDVFQSSIMLAGLLAIVIQGSIVVGGMTEVWNINDAWGRIDFFDFNPDPTQRHSFWSLVVGGTIGWTSTYGVNQASVQRYCALPTLKKAKLSVMLNVIGVIILLTLTSLTGIVVFAYYAQKGCDPLSAGYVSNSNQLIPYFVMEVLGYPGLPGLFISCLFSGALSTMSSCLNALAAVTWEDFLKPHFDYLTERKKTYVTKLLVLLYGGAGIGMAFMAKNLGGTVLQASLSFTGAASGPLLGMFCLGAFFKWANWIGVVVGAILGLIFPLWISIGAYSVISRPGHLLFPTNSCSIANITLTTAMTPISTIVEATTAGYEEPTGILKLYTVSYLWYPAIGAATVVVVGLILSLITAPYIEKQEVDPKYLIPLFDRLFCCLPESMRKPLRCGIEYRDPEEILAEQNVEFTIEPPNEETEKSPSTIQNGEKNGYFINDIPEKYGLNNPGFNSDEKINVNLTTHM